MPRKKLKCALPTLRRPADAKGELEDDQLLEILRRLATTHRRTQPQLFYPLRDAARGLRAPLSAISRVYEVLKAEGLLRTIRASKTLLEGREAAPRISFKGFIDLPLPLSSFLLRSDYRSFYFALRQESARRGFLTNPVFIGDEFESGEELDITPDTVVGRYVVWFSPRPSDRAAILGLKDRGVRVVAIADRRGAPVYCKYELCREQALDRILKDWRTRRGIERVAIFRSDRDGIGRSLVIEHALERADLSFDRVDIQDGFLPEAAPMLGPLAWQGAILPAESASLCDLRAPTALRNLARRCRLLLPDGPLTSFDNLPPLAPVDVLVVDWKAVVRRMIHGLETKKAFEESKPTVFEASAETTDCSSEQVVARVN
jgi:hypothetical protein